MKVLFHLHYIVNKIYNEQFSQCKPNVSLSLTDSLIHVRKHYRIMHIVSLRRKFNYPNQIRYAAGWQESIANTLSALSWLISFSSMRDKMTPTYLIGARFMHVDWSNI